MKEKRKILSVFTGWVTNSKPRAVNIQSVFSVGDLPYKIDFTVGATIMFSRGAEAFNLRFDIYDPFGNELNNETHEVDPDLEINYSSLDGLGCYLVSLTPSSHAAKTEGVYKVTATLTDEDEEVIEKMDTFFILSKKWIGGEY